MTVCQATLTEITSMGPEVLRVVLRPHDERFVFLAGQWIDLAVNLEHEQVVAGYSPASSPSQSGSFELGVRLGRTNRVSQWFHHEAKVGDEVTISGGHGSCVYLPQADDSVVFVAGGIGVTPLLSMLHAFVEHPSTRQATFFLSCSQASVVPFWETLETLANDSRVTLHLIETTDSTDESRLSARKLFENGGKASDTFYLCGPAAMIDEISHGLVRESVPAERIRFEKWW